MKTPAPQRTAGRKKLAAMGQALPGGSFPIPTVDYLKKAIRSVGRAPASKRPALAALIRKRAKALGATSAPGVKGTWAFQAANDGAAVELVGPHGYVHGWIKVGAEPGSDQTSSIEWLKSGKTNWAARSNAYTIERTGDGQHIVRDGHGRQVGEPARTLQAAKVAAQRHQDRGVVGGAADEHIAKAKQADAEGRHADAINHLGAAINATADKSAAFHLTELRAEMAARAMGVPYKAKPMPKRLHAMANDDTEALDMAMATTRKMPMIRGAADVQMGRTGPGVITVMHKSTGMKVGTIAPKGRGFAGMHATGTATGASGSQQGALTGLIAYHNQMAAKAKAGAAATAMTYTAGEQAAVELATGPAPYHRDPDENVQCPACKKYNDEDARYCDQCGAKLPASAYESAASLANGARAALNLAGAPPMSTPAASASDGPRVTSMSAGKPAAAPAGSPSGLSPYALAIYKKFIARKMKPAVALAFAKRADAMHDKAAKAA